MPLIPRLREATADLHVAVEQRLSQVDSFGSIDQLVITLGAFYGFQLPWENAVRRQAAIPSNTSDANSQCIAPAHCRQLAELMEPRWRAHLLEADLAHFGVPGTSLPLCRALPSVGTLGGILGSLYVMEGSTLGGQVISRHLEHRLGLSGGVGYSYFKGGGAAIGSHWRQFLATLADMATSVGEDEVIAGAVDTFGSLDRWFERTLSRREVSA